MLTSKLPKAFQSFRKPSKSLPYLSKTPNASKTFPSIHWTKARLPTFQSIRKHPKASQSLPMPSKAFQSLPKPPRASQTLPKLPRGSQNFPKPPRASVRDILCSSHSLPKPPKAFQKLPKAFQSQSPPKHDKAIQSLENLPKPPKASQNCT